LFAAKRVEQGRLRKKCYNQFQLIAVGFCNWILLSSFRDDSSLHISVLKQLVSNCKISREAIGKCL